MNNQQDSQKTPLNEAQIAWINEKYGKAFHREAKPMVCKCGDQDAKEETKH